MLQIGGALESFAEAVEFDALKAPDDEHHDESDEGERKVIMGGRGIEGDNCFVEELGKSS